MDSPYILCHLAFCYCCLPYSVAQKGPIGVVVVMVVVIIVIVVVIVVIVAKVVVTKVAYIVDEFAKLMVFTRES